MSREVVVVIHRAPGKRGKQEFREFATYEEAMAYVDRNTVRREHDRLPRLDAKDFRFIYRRKR